MVYWYDIIEYIGSENRLVFRYLRFREKNCVVLLSCIFALTVLFLRIHLMQGLYVVVLLDRV